MYTGMGVPKLRGTFCWEPLVLPLSSIVLGAYIGVSLFMERTNNVLSALYTLALQGFYRDIVGNCSGFYVILQVLPPNL